MNCVSTQMAAHFEPTMPSPFAAQIFAMRVRKLADDIIKAQRLEIDEMKALIADLQGGPKATPEIDGR